MSKQEIDLSKIFKSNEDFQDPKNLIKNLYSSVATHEEVWDSIFQECLKQAISSRNTQDLIHSNEKLTKSQKLIWIAGIVLAVVWLLATIIFWIAPWFRK